MKIGDVVRSKKWGTTGIIKDIRPCMGDGCSKIECSLDEVDESKIRFYYHTDSFEVIDDPER